MDGWQGVIALVLTNVGSIAIGYFTRRSAKESNVNAQHATAGNLFSAVTSVQVEELLRLGGRVQQLEEDRDQDRKAVRAHLVWDRMMARRLRAAFPDEEFPDPPPLND